MPVITISRMYGSGGSEVAERVAQALGWSLFDNDMVDAVAERSGLTRAEVSAQDERVPSMVERLASALSLGSPEIMPPVPSGPIEIDRRANRRRDAPRDRGGGAGGTGGVRRTRRAVSAAERSDALHVFCFAPRSALRRYAMEKFGVSAAEADRMVGDAEQAARAVRQAALESKLARA